MEKELAREVVITCYRSGSLLGSLMPMLKQHCSAEEYAPFRKAIPGLIVAIHEQLEQRVYALYPELEAEVGDHIEKFDQLT